MKGNEYRLSEFLNPVGHKGLIVDASAGMALGTLPGLIDYPAAVRPILGLTDGVVCSPGQLRRLTANTQRPRFCAADRNLVQPLPSGLACGHMVEFDPMLDEYYVLVGWDSNGIPTPEGLKKIGLDSLL